MRYWWVSQNQTFEHEVSGGYMWSPKTKSDGALNHYYETMRMVSRGDFIFSFKDKKIMAVGFVRGAAYTCPKPLEFGTAGAYWNQIGWRVDVNYLRLSHPIQPRDHMRVLGPLLPQKHAPIRPDGTIPDPVPKPHFGTRKIWKETYRTRSNGDGLAGSGPASKPDAIRQGKVRSSRYKQCQS